MQNQNLKFKDKRIGILGLGEENLALVKFLLANGCQNITICDQKTKGELSKGYEEIKNLPAIKFCLGRNYLNDLEDFDILFRTPGLPYLHQKIQAAKKAGVEVSSQIKLFFQLCPCSIIGVTGTKGKGTTATLIYEILRAASGRPSLSATHSSPVSISPSVNRDAGISLGASPRPLKSNIYLGGNIGTPPISFLSKLSADDLVVLELSSFQLQDMTKSPHIAVVLDIKVDHLDYHQNRKEYVEAKMNIVKFQNKNDFAVINADYLTSFEFAAQTRARVFWFSRRKSIDEGCWIRGKEIVLRMDDQDFTITKTDNLLLKGQHNLENIAAAACAARLAGANLEFIKKTLETFKGLEHRLEFLRTINGVSFYNDSFSTTPDTTIAAIRSFDAPIILLLGGSEKNADYAELGRVIQKDSVKAVISIGLTAKKIIEAIGPNSKIKIIHQIQPMNQAVKLALSKATADDVVLLSPASASFDHFKNYKERGEIFKRIVEKYAQT